MPHISLTLYKGRSREQLEGFAKVLEESLIANTTWSPEDISVSIEEADPDDFVETVESKIKDEEIYSTSSLIK